jgi:hypothetical protein
VHFAPAIALLQGLFIQLRVYGEDFDIDTYARSAAELLDQRASCGASRSGAP